MSRKKSGQFDPNTKGNELESKAVLSDASKKLNTEDGLLFGNQNTQLEELNSPKEQNTHPPVQEQQTVSPEITIPSDAEEQEPTLLEQLQVRMKEMHRNHLLRKEAQAKELEKPKPAYRSKLPMAIIGLLVSVFAIIGFIWTGSLVVKGIASSIRQDGLKDVLKENVYPLVIVDTPEFEDPDALDQKVVIAAGIWKFIMEEPDADQKYETDDFGTMTVPQVAIEPYIRELFGNSIKIQHQMIPDTDFYIPYDEENQVYYIPNNPQLLPYAPRIESVKKLDGSKYEVEVGYILAGPFWDTGRYLDDEPSKTMKYTMEKNDYSSYQILSVEQVVEEGQEFDDPPVSQESSVTSSESSESTSDDSVPEETSSSIPEEESSTASPSPEA